MGAETTVTFVLGGQIFEYDSEKEAINLKKHGISFRTAARVFFDEDYIEEADFGHSDDEQRYNVIGDTSAGNIFRAQEERGLATIGRVDRFVGDINDILYVVYTERTRKEESGKLLDIIRIISARLANNFERGLYFGQYL
ncbi:MAG: BrnT family toxin [Eubacterium sp.]|nr:BrnT family toxin [Eubacterium sp.]